MVNNIHYVFPFSFNEYVKINGINPNNKPLTITTADSSKL